MNRKRTTVVIAAALTGLAAQAQAQAGGPVGQHPQASSMVADVEAVLRHATTKVVETQDLLSSTTN